jgi:hypothetical protein
MVVIALVVIAAMYVLDGRSASAVGRNHMHAKNFIQGPQERVFDAE